MVGASQIWAGRDDVPSTKGERGPLQRVSARLTGRPFSRAARQGHLSLDDDIRRHLPEIPDYGTPVTVRHLVHHTSGLRDYLALMHMAGMRYEDVHPDQELIELMARQEALNFEPGDEFLYSNSGYFLLAEIVRRTTGQSLREFAQENIFGPLGMTHTRFHDDRTEVVPHRAMAYESDDDGYRLLWYLNFDKVGSGGLLTTVEDLLLWDRAFYSDPLADGGLVGELLERGVLNDGTVLDYAFALRHGEHRGLRTIDHAGSFMGFRAQLVRFPDERVSVVTLCNLAGSIRTDWPGRWRTSSSKTGSPGRGEPERPTGARTARRRRRTARQRRPPARGSRPTRVAISATSCRRPTPSR